jgi:hypothetical protein
VAIDDKPAARWTEDDLRELCDRHRRETARLEFKSELELGTDAQKMEAEKDAEGMAAAGGGHIIYGIGEDELEDGVTAAARLTPLADGTLYEQLNNVLDSRGEPRLPFEIHSIQAADGGSYLVVEIFGHRRPHRSSNSRYYIRRNVLVREMTEAEIAESYRERFIREAAALGAGQPPENAAGNEARAQQRELLEREFALYRAETGSDRDPPWLSALAIPMEAAGTVIDPMVVQPAQLYELSLGLEDRWRPEETPLEHFRLQRTTQGFYGQLPDRDDTYPRYLVRFWRNGVSEFGDLLEPMFDPEPRVIPSAAVVEYVHDFLTLAHRVYQLVGYDGQIAAEARLENVEGYTPGVRPDAYFPNLRPISDEVVAPPPWQGDLAELPQGAAAVARDLADYLFLAAGADRHYLFEDGQYIGRRTG